MQAAAENKGSVVAKRYYCVKTIEGSVLGWYDAVKQDWHSGAGSDELTPKSKSAQMDVATSLVLSADQLSIIQAMLRFGEAQKEWKVQVLRILESAVFPELVSMMIGK